MKKFLTILFFTIIGVLLCFFTIVDDHDLWHKLAELFIGLSVYKD